MNTGYHLTLLIGPTIPIPAPRPVMEALESVECHSAAGERSGFSLNFKVSNRSVLHTILSLVPAQVPWLRAIVVVTVQGTPHVLADGLVTNQQLSPGSEGSSTFTIMGEDVSIAMDKQQFNGLPYPAMPAEVRVALICAKYAMFGVVPLPVPTMFKDIAIPVERFEAHEGTDLAYINKLAEDVGYTFYIDPGPLPGMNTAYWGPDIKVGIPQKSINYIDYLPGKNGEAINFSFQSSDAELPVVFIQNQLTKFPIPLPIPNISILNPPLGLVSGIPKKITLLNDTANLSPMAALGKGLARASRTADAVSAEGSLDAVRYGSVLKARGLVGVRGAGPSFDGLYYVKKVTSSIKRGEFKQSFSLTRNGLLSTVPAVPV